MTHTEKTEKMNIRTVVASVGAMTALAILVGIWIAPEKKRETQPVEQIVQIDAKLMEAWLLAAEALADQRSDGTVALGSRNLADFVEELTQDRTRHEGKLALAGMSYPRFLAVTRAIHFARAKLRTEAAVAEQIDQLHQAQANVQVNHHAADGPPPLMLPEHQKPQRQSGAQTASITTYQQFSGQVERVLDRLALVS